MNKLRLSAGLVFGLVFLCAPATSIGQDQVTLHSILKHRGEQRVFCINFRPGATGGYSTRPCDLRYGSLYVGEERDWLEISAARESRSVIKDLGYQNWDQPFTVPVMQPLPKLQPDEKRRITVDASGADGADGAPGACGRDGVDGDGVWRPKSIPGSGTQASKRPAKPKHDGKLRVDPIFVQARAGHMYAIHVVDDKADFYVVLRVETIERGSSCTISWRLVRDPSAEVGQNQK